MKIYSLYTDMMKQTHILIAGATGSGKSVVINSLIGTALTKRPKEVGFIFIDPKRVELVEYTKLPHTLYYASEPDDMVNALEYAMELCDSRYKAMQAAGVKKYQGSHIYVIIDELADLMTTDKKRVMPLIQRLCQIGRAAAISVIAATQCPLATVIPTPVKVNFDSIVALHTVSAQHSRNIMDATGCEKLPRYGKAYYITPDRREIVNVPMVTEEERAEVIEYWVDAYKAAKAEEAAKAARAAAAIEHAARALEARRSAARREADRKATPAPKPRKTLFKRLFA